MTPPLLRGLPAVPSAWERHVDVVVVGSGAAGMSAAMAAASHGRRVVLVCKDDLGGGATPLAQGGLAAAIGPGDTPGLHLRDTLNAGQGLCEPAAAAELASGAPQAAIRLAGLGAELELAALGLEGGHSQRRIVRAGGDAIGAAVHKVLERALLASPVEIVTRAVALDALVDAQGTVGGLIVGVIGGDRQTLRAGTITAHAVVLATGGFGQAYATTSNPDGVTGDGHALAVRAGAELRDVEFVQFHPTVMWQEGARGQCPLVTEALRGAGAVLKDAAGRPVMADRHPLGDLAPRDIVAAAMHERMTTGNTLASHLWLDATALGRRSLEENFPTVTAACRARGIEPAAGPIPVAPGAHYGCGGIRAGLDGRTSLAGLYAVGEVASTGVHGANRLASNSLTESLIAGRQVGELLGRRLPAPAGPLRPPPQGPGVHPSARSALAAAMSCHAGVVRDRLGLERLLDLLNEAPAAAVTQTRLPGADPVSQPLTLETVEATSLHTVSALVALAAVTRAESRGCHRRRDAPDRTAARHTMLCWRDGRLRVTSGAAQATEQDKAA